MKSLLVPTVGNVFNRHDPGRRARKREEIHHMSPQDATTAAQAILERRSGEKEFKVSVDNPADFRRTVHAFKHLGCKVKEIGSNGLLLITPPNSD
jgi:hypothetical protein